MFVVLLKFSANKSKAPQLMKDHNEWIKKGFDEGSFFLVGSLKLGLGGAILAHNTSKEELLARVQKDPFVSENVVSAEILEIAPNQAIPEMNFLLEN